MVNKFHTKFFQVQEKVTTLTLGRDVQKEGEDILDSVKRFQDKAIDCHEPVDEAHLVNICVEGAIRDYKIFLVNHNLPTISTLIEAARNLSTTSPLHRSRDSHRYSCSNRVAAVTVAGGRRSQGEATSSRKRKSYEDRNPCPCSLENVKSLVKEWVADGELNLPPVDVPPTKKDKENPDYCVYHKTTRHSTRDCWTLKSIFKKKVDANELKFKDASNRDVRKDPYPNHKGKGYTYMIGNLGSVRDQVHMASYYDELEEIATGQLSETVYLQRQNSQRMLMPRSLDAPIWSYPVELSPMREGKVGKAHSNHINASEQPFGVEEEHYSDAVFFTELSTGETPRAGKIAGVKLPKWESIREVGAAPESSGQKRSATLQVLRSRLLRCGKAVRQFTTYDRSWRPGFIPWEDGPETDKCDDDESQEELVEMPEPASECVQDKPESPVFISDTMIKMASEDAEKTAFRTPWGNFFDMVMPFGFKNVGATYQRAMTAVFHDMLHHEMEVYVDDLVVKSTKANRHLCNLEKAWLLILYVGLALRENILRVNGSDIYPWWIKHHYFAMAMALISLTWETQKQAGRMDVVWGETAGVDGQLWLLAPILFILQETTASFTTTSTTPLFCSSAVVRICRSLKITRLGLTAELGVDSPPTFPSPSPRSDPNPNKFAFQNPKISSRLRRSSYSLSSSPHSLSRVSDSALCRCHRNNDDSASASPSDNSSSVNRRWDSVIQEVLRNAVKKFNDYMNSYRNQSKGVLKSVDVFERGSEVVDDEDWDWDRWRKHFSEVDEQERIVLILKVIQRLEPIISQFGFYSRTSYSLQVHPTVEAFKHAYAVRMNIGDHDFVNVSSAVSNMLSPKFAASFTAASGIKFQSQSTGIVLSNEMGDFSSSRSLSPPPAPSNYIQPFKRALPSMTPTIVLKGKKLKAVLVNSQCAVLWTSSLGDQYAAIVNAQEEGPCHALHSVDGRTICQLVAQKLECPNLGMLVAANDPRKDMKDDLCSPLDGAVVSVPNRQSSAGSSLRCSIRLPSLPTVLSQDSRVHHALNPDPYSGVFGSDREKYARDVEDLITFGTSGHVAGFISEAIQGVGGIIELAPGYFPAVYINIEKAGGLCIADEVQSGFAHTGSHCWGFETQGIVPDIVTMAKKRTSFMKCVEDFIARVYLQLNKIFQCSVASISQSQTSSGLLLLTINNQSVILRKLTWAWR
ncbi:unnamed protein product [Camellia sinensis]